LPPLNRLGGFFFAANAVAATRTDDSERPIPTIAPHHTIIKFNSDPKIATAQLKGAIAEISTCSLMSLLMSEVDLPTSRTALAQTLSQC